MRVNVAVFVIAAVFGTALCWTGMTSPEVIRGALLFKDSYLFLFFGSAVATAFVGLRILRATRERAILVNRPIPWARQRPERRHVTGAFIFGLGWGICDACPGPIATQLGMGIAWGIPTAVGLGVGVWVYMRRQEQEATAREPLGGRGLAHGLDPVGEV